MNTKIHVYDTTTNSIVEIEVSENIAKEYKRTKWLIEKNDSSFYEHQIQFSQLVGGDDGAFENFKEFVIDNDPTYDTAIKRSEIERLLKALGKLKPYERELIEMIYFDELSERDCALHYGISQKNINKKKERILVKLNKLLENSSK